MRTTFPRRPSTAFFSPANLAASPLLVPLVALGMLFAADCGSSSGQKNPPPPKVVIKADAQFLDVGQRYVLDGSQTTDPNNPTGTVADMTFEWRLVDGGLDTAIDDHCRDNFDEVCTSNANDFCSNDNTRFCHVDADCQNFGTCKLNSGTSSADCTTGICGLGEGITGVKATMLANVAGQFSVRLTAKGKKSNGTRTMVLDTYPSLYVVGSLIQFGGTEGGLVGPVADAEQYASGASEGVANPANGNLLVIDDSLGLVREFDLRSGKIVGTFGETDRFVTDPAALAFHPDNGRLYVAQADGKVLMFDGSTGLLISTFGNVGADPISMRFSPVTGELLVVNGQSGSGVVAYDSAGNSLGVLGDTDTATTQPVDVDFHGSQHSLLIADRTGRVVRCSFNGTNCGSFSSDADGMLAAGSPSALAVNPSADDTTADVLIADPVAKRVIACDANGDNCSTFGDTADLDSQYEDVFFAPTSAPTTTTSTSTTTTTTLK